MPTTLITGVLAATDGAPVADAQVLIKPVQRFIFGVGGDGQVPVSVAAVTNALGRIGTAPQGGGFAEGVRLPVGQYEIAVVGLERVFGGKLTVTQEMVTAGAVALGTTLEAAPAVAFGDITAARIETLDALAQTLTARDRAAEWAWNPEDGEVIPGLFSARHYALKAMGFRDAASASATSASTSAASASTSATDSAASAATAQAVAQLQADYLLSSAQLGRDLAALPDEPALVLDFARGAYGRGDAGGVNAVDVFGDAVTFTRASTATYWDADGVLQTAPADTPRFERDPITGEALGLRVEAASTNMLLHSNDLMQSPWALIVATRAAATPGPGFAMFRITATSDTVFAPRIQQSIVDPALGKWTASFFARPASNGLINFLVTPTNGATIGGVANSVTGSFNPNTGTFTLSGAPAVRTSATRVAQDLWRIEVVFDVTAAPLSSSVFFQLPVANATVAVGEWAEFGLVQLEQLAAMTSPIITGASAVTRAADNAEVAGDLTRLGISDAVTAMVFGRDPRSASSDGLGGALAIRNGTDLQLLAARRFADGDPPVAYFQNVTFEANSRVTASTLPVIQPGDPVRLALAVDGEFTRAAHNGLIVWSREGGVLADMQRQILIGRLTATPSRFWGGTIARIVLWPRRLTDGHLEKLP